MTKRIMLSDVLCEKCAEKIKIAKCEGCAEETAYVGWPVGWGKSGKTKKYNIKYEKHGIAWWCPDCLNRFLSI